MRRALPIALLVALLVFSLAAAKAEAVTPKDIIDLTKAGLGEEVLLALIEVDGGVFNIDTPTLTDLKKAGVSERVIEAMVRSGRMPPPPEPPEPVPVYEPEPPAAQPQVIVIEHERPVVEQVVVPVYIPVAVRSRSRGHVVPVAPFDPSPGFGAPTPPQHQKKAEPVYWGWGGKLRPDAYKPAESATPHQKKQQDGTKPQAGKR
jgi:hypothetical protein